MSSTTSVLLAIALIVPPTVSNVPSAPTWETLPAEQPLSAMAVEGYVDPDGARIWYGTAGKGEPVVLLHGGMASSLSWGNQVPALIKTHHKVILIDSRGHGRSTLGPYPLSYEKMQSDVVAIMDTLHLKKASFVGWSDGAIISLIMAIKNPERVNSVYAFGANMNTGHRTRRFYLAYPLRSGSKAGEGLRPHLTYARRIRHSSPGTRNDAEEGAQLHDEGARCYQRV